MSNETNWYDYDEGYSVGTVGASGGAIVRDEEHESGARITLEEESNFAPFAIYLRNLRLDVLHAPLCG